MRLAGPILITSTLIAASAWANLRPPQILNSHASRLEASWSGTVLSEELSFDCPAVHNGRARPDLRLHCQARAIYSIDSKAAEDVRLRFLYSGGEKVHWSIGSRQESSAGRNLPVKNPEGENAGNCNFCDESIVLKEATIETPLPPGLLSIGVTYDQLLSLKEVGHGYGSSGRFEQSFAYEIWPIKGWKRSPDFAIKLSINVPPGKRWLGLGRRPVNLKCTGETAGQSEPIDLQTNSGYSKFEAKLSTIPDRLQCSYRNPD
ncbi:MAG: hypothetical protein HS115_05415 [Spirochaetales bacterium]|nr:hypothetical protein [Spirochaetales bacterium]